jgi:hypothetical protein
VSNNATFAETAVTAIVSSGVLWGGAQWILNRRQRKSEERKSDREHEKATLERREMLAEAQNIAQRTALESAADRYTQLRADYMDCRDGLIQIRDATALLIDVFENLLVRLRPDDSGGESYTAKMSLDELGASRRAINEARRHLH